MRALRSAGSILEFETRGDPPDRYQLVFRGRGLHRNSIQNEVRPVDEHRVEIRLPDSYPDRPPDVRWSSPIFHPNVSFSGYLNLQDIGLSWHEEMGLDELCVRLWDVARLAYLDLDHAKNYSAKRWFEQQQEFLLPTDPRGLGDRTVAPGSNIVRYSRRREGRSLRGESQPADILFIGEDTVPPDWPKLRRERPDDEDILYIGDE